MLHHKIGYAGVSACRLGFPQAGFENGRVKLMVSIAVGYISRLFLIVALVISSPKNSSLRLRFVTCCPPITRLLRENMSSSELSELSSVLSSEDENILEPTQVGVLENYFKKGAGRAIRISPPAKKQRPASPPHEYVLADNPDIAVSLHRLIESRSSLIYGLLKYFRHRFFACSGPVSAMHSPSRFPIMGLRTLKTV